MRTAIVHSLKARINKFEKAKLCMARCYTVMTTILTCDKASTSDAELFVIGPGPMEA